MSNYGPIKNGYTLAEAAVIHQVNKLKLMRCLRQAGILLPDNTPTREQIECGNFSVQHGGFVMPGTNINRHTQRAIVTPRGMKLLERVIATHPEIIAASHGGRNSPAQNPSRTQRSTAAGARKLARAG